MGSGDSISSYFNRSPDPGSVSVSQEGVSVRWGRNETTALRIGMRLQPMGTKSAPRRQARSGAADCCGYRPRAAFRPTGGGRKRGAAAAGLRHPDDHTITYSYNADNEETGETWVNPSGGTPLDVFDYGYNADGELTSVSDDNSALPIHLQRRRRRDQPGGCRLARPAVGDTDLRL